MSVIVMVLRLSDGRRMDGELVGEAEVVASGDTTRFTATDELLGILHEAVDAACANEGARR